MSELSTLSRPVDLETSFVKDAMTTGKLANTELTVPEIFKLVNIGQRFSLLAPLKIFHGASIAIVGSADQQTLESHAQQTTNVFIIKEQANPKSEITRESTHPEYFALVPEPYPNRAPILNSAFPVLDMDEPESAALLQRKDILYGPQTRHMRLVQTVLTRSIARLIEANIVVSSVRPLKECNFLYNSDAGKPTLQ